MKKHPLKPRKAVPKTVVFGRMKKLYLRVVFSKIHKGEVVIASLREVRATLQAMWWEPASIQSNVLFKLVCPTLPQPIAAGFIPQFCRLRGLIQSQNEQFTSCYKKPLCKKTERFRYPIVQSSSSNLEGEIFNTCAILNKVSKDTPRTVPVPST